jgi:N-acyl-D-amino-acid deacylase
LNVLLSFDLAVITGKDEAMNENHNNHIVHTLLIAICMFLGTAAPADPVVDPPIQGVDVNELAWLNPLMTIYMEDNSISGGILGIMKDGDIVYQRGFGWKDEDREVKMPENALFRIASCTKPITAAAIRQLISENKLSLSQNIFNLEGNGGILNHSPFPDGIDPNANLKTITVQHCLSHSAGWDPNLAGVDYWKVPCDIASDFEIESPPGIDRTIRWILGKPLQYTPGFRVEYTGIGYHMLGKVIETRSGMNVLNYHRAYVLTPDMWVPKTDLFLGKTFAEDQTDIREVWYDPDGNRKECVFRRGDLLPPCVFYNEVDKPYGGWHHESYVGGGGIVASAATMLEFAQRYYVQIRDPNIGTPLSYHFQLTADSKHGGRLTGVKNPIGRME